MPLHSGLVAAALCCLATVALAQDTGTIQKLNDSFMAAFAKGDMKTLAGMYTEDAFLLPPGAEIVKARAAVQAFWTKAAEGIAEIKLTTVDVKRLGGDAAREIGTYSLKTKGSAAQEITGKYVVVWEYGGGGWKLGTDIWNPNK